MKAIYIVTLEGSEVFHNQSFEGCIESFTYNWEYDNITDNRDIKLMVYKTELVERD